MNIDCLVDFKKLTVIDKSFRRGLAYYWELEVRIGGELVKIGRLKDKRFIKISNQVIEVKELLDINRILLIKSTKDEYYLLKINFDKYLGKKSNTDMVGLVGGIVYHSIYLDAVLIKCENMYDVACGIGIIPQGDIPMTFRWESKDNGINSFGSMIDDYLEVDTINQKICGIDKEHKDYILSVGDKWFIQDTITYFGITTYQVVYDLKDNKYMFIQLVKDDCYRVLYETPNKLTANHHELIEYVSDSKTLRHKIELSFIEVGDIEINYAN
jgi:hypothetical protein